MSEVSREQQYVTGLYGRVDVLRGQAAARLALALRCDGGTAQARLEREAAISRYAGQLARLDAAENGLCFGRLDLRGGECRHIGRIGLRDEADEGEPLLIDWRAPAARAFYVATAGAPHGVRRRRHITMRGRRVTGVADEVLDRAGLAGAPGLTGEAALLAALEASRTGRMGDIVGTLQAEQDAIIRSAHSGVPVVQGGPGTGKTAVALHRAAYLLYTHRRLAERGVLVVGPSPVFLGYISRVLAPLAGDRWRLARLTVNYRTPAEIMAATASLLAAIDPGQQPPRSVREAGVPPWRMGIARDALPATLAEVTAAEAAAGGQLAVIVPDTRVAELGDAVSRAVPGLSFGGNPDLASPVVLLGARQAKGLEFDSVLIADPAAILAGSPRGRNDLYVAMTRSTQRLGVLHPGQPPAELATLPERRP